MSDVVEIASELKEVREALGNLSEAVKRPGFLSAGVWPVVGHQSYQESIEATYGFEWRDMGMVRRRTRELLHAIHNCALIVGVRAEVRPDGTVMTTLAVSRSWDGFSDDMPF